MNSKAYTLTEMMIVTIIISILAGMAITNYQKAVKKAKERDAVIQLNNIHGANLAYKAKNSAFWNAGSVGTYTEATINTNLKINLIPSTGVSYTYQTYGNGNYSAKVAVDSNNYVVGISNGVPGYGNGNPCCYSGVCPSLANC